MIIPIGHERGTVLRLPWVTLAIIGLCILVYVYELRVVSSHEQRERQLRNDALQYYLDHPRLEPDSRLIEHEWMVRKGGEDVAKELFELMGGGEERPATETETAREQEKLDQITAEWLETKDEHPFRRWGLVPADYSFSQTLTYMFFHAGILHLLGNIFILYLAGAPIEDVWGRPLFGLFYVAAGVFSGLMYAVSQSGSQVPCIGASGAIAGVMGAFLVRYWMVNIKFFYFIWFWVRIYSGTFHAPAWLMLPLWFLNELWMGYLTSHLAPDGGVAYWAHVWGFVFGAAVAGVVKLMALEERYLKGQIHAKIGLMENKTLEEAYEARRQGDLEETRRLLEEELRQRPANREAALALWDVAVKSKEAGEVAPRMMRCIWEELREGEVELALGHWEELKVYAPDVPVNMRLKVRLAEVLAEHDRPEEALEMVRSACADGRRMPPVMTVRLARAAAGLDPALAADTARRGLEVPELPAEVRQQLEEIAAQAAAQAEVTPEAAEQTPAEPEAPGQRNAPVFVASSAVPERLTSDRLIMDLEGKGRVALRLSRIHAVGAAHIEEAGYRPYDVVDLFIDPLSPDVDRARLVRCLGSQFDPQELVEAELDPGLAFCALVDALLNGSRGRLYPEDVAVRENRPRTFPSLEDYENAIRDALRRRAAKEGPEDDEPTLLPPPELPPPPPLR